ncbi:MAG: hypothetical protein QOH06_1596 [Acidobacteriota bacterium]|jgi:hypothetical protein|nr:hypothetical protein [Acidobacteriota bacterium]
MAKNLDGGRVRQYLGQEVRSLLEAYRQFETLLPSGFSKGAAHRGEDGRYIESLVRTYLRRLLPSSLEVASGFILRPAVKTGNNGRERKGDVDTHSTQLDVLIYDSAHYPVFQRFGDNIIVPPEGVVAIISIKKNLRDKDVVLECQALRQASKLCRLLDASDRPMRGPFLALLGVQSYIQKKRVETPTWMFEQIREAYSGESVPTFDEVVGYVGTLNDVSLFKARPQGEEVRSAKFVYIKHKQDEHHWSLQLILTGILSVMFDPTRNYRRRPGFSAFQPGRQHDDEVGELEVVGLR